MAENDDKTLAHIEAHNEVRSKPKIYQRLSPERQAHQDCRNTVLTLLDTLVTESADLNNSLFELLAAGEPSFPRRRLQLVRDRFEQLTEVIEEESSTSRVMAATSPYIFPMLMGVTPYTTVYPEEAYLLLTMNRLKVGMDYVFTPLDYPKDEKGKLLPGMAINREGLMLMRPRVLAEKQGVHLPYPKEVKYQFNDQGSTMVADYAHIADATVNAPIPLELLVHFGTTDFTRDGENATMMKRWLLGDLLTPAQKSVIAINDQLLHFQYLERIRGNLLRRPSMDNLIEERGYNW